MRRFATFLLSVIISVIVCYSLAAVLGESGTGDTGLIVSLLITISLQISFLTVVCIFKKQ